MEAERKALEGIVTKPAPAPQAQQPVEERLKYPFTPDTVIAVAASFRQKRSEPKRRDDLWSDTLSVWADGLERRPFLPTRRRSRLDGLQTLRCKFTK
jgi:hypothetical protein